jgi:predicted TPR repeat methyltransferase
VIDLGCGTGLVGAALAGRPEHLTGIDLSPGMLAEAGRRGLYHRLVEGELIAALAAEDPDSADCVTAADVMIYVGDVSGMVSGSARVLRAGGRFAFTVQSHSGDGLILGPDARYAHGDALVRETLAAAGLDLERFAPAVARRENGVDVPGRVIVARRPDRSRFRCRP